MVRNACRSAIVRIIPVIIAAVLLVPAEGRAIVRPLVGEGDFVASVDVVNRWRDQGVLDVVVLVEVTNADLSYKEEDGGLVARLRIEADLYSLDGLMLSDKRPVRTAVLSADEAGSPTLRQTFGLVLSNVPFRAGRIDVRVYDVNARKEGLLNEMRKRSRISAATGAWAAHEGPEAARGVALEDPLFLAHAPLDRWNPAALDAADGGGLLHDYAHPSRRYGLEQDRLQVFIPVWPPSGGLSLDDAAPGLRVAVTSLDMDVSVIDTIGFDATGRAALAAGRPAGLFYELDVNLLPEGSFLLNVAPLDRQGRGALAQFDVVWRLDALARRPGQVRGEGRTIFSGAELDAFLAASPGEQEGRLKAYWDSVNPDPSSPLNAAYLEFQYRLAFVRQFLGGFDEWGARDPRGEIFLALGAPDQVKTEHMPMNYRDQDDARINVFNRFAPDREGTMARANSGSDAPSPYSAEDPIPQPWSHRAENQRATSQQTAAHLFAFELWEYDNGGKSLWPNRFSHSGMGQRFLFVDRTGTGQYFLESSNVVQGEE
ncbi:MAG TPA: GWxTD domain-containing protein [Candidatus Krumholzibacteria bacterium]|nr:GWxTD domain-containing protein [Candidatus Krumholzibacteria bacterium]